VAGLGVKNGVHAIISDTMQGLADETVKLLKNPELLKKIGRAGQKLVEEKYDWKAIVRLHDDVYREAIRRNEK